MGTLEHYVRAYGYAGIVLFAMVGGEEVALMGGVLAREGYLSLPAVIASAALGGSLGDQAYFHFARFCGKRFRRDRLPAQRPDRPRGNQQPRHSHGFRNRPPATLAQVQNQFVHALLFGVNQFVAHFVSAAGIKTSHSGPGRST